MYKKGQLFMFNTDGVNLIWAIVDVDKEKDRYILECVEECEQKGVRREAVKSIFDANVTTELPRIIPADEKNYMQSAREACEQLNEDLGERTFDN